MNARDDESLLHSFAMSRSDEAFRALVERYAPLVYSVCLGELRRTDLAEDAAQAVFILLAERAGRIHVRTSLVGWLYKTGRLVCHAARRKERRRMNHETPLTDHSAPAREDSADIDLRRALAILSPTQREAVLLRFFQGFSLKEVGRIQGTSEDAARMRIQRALERMKPALAGHGEERLTAPSVSSALLATTLQTASPNAHILARATTALMTTTTITAIAAYTAGFIVVGLISNRTVQATMPPNTSAPSSQIAAAVTPTSQEPTKPGAPAPKIPTLDKPFTLVYRMTITDVRTPAMKEAAIAARMKELAEEVDADRKTQAQADEEIAEARKPVQPRIKTITLSYNGRTLLFDEPSSGSRNDAPSVNLFNGDYSYHFNPGQKDFDAQGQRCPGTVSYYTWNIPYVGPTLPLFPLSQGGKVLNTFRWDTKLVYTTGEIKQDKGGSAARIVLGNTEPPAYEIVLSGYSKLGSRLVARSISVTKRDYHPDSVARGVPFEQIEYSLVSASPTPLPAARFLPDTYISNGDSFKFYASPQDRNPRRFEVDRSKGTLLQQIAAAGSNR